MLGVFLNHFLTYILSQSLTKFRACWFGSPHSQARSKDSPSSFPRVGVIGSPTPTWLYVVLGTHTLAPHLPGFTSYWAPTLWPSHLFGTCSTHWVFSSAFLFYCHPALGSLLTALKSPLGMHIVLFTVKFTCWSASEEESIPELYRSPSLWPASSFHEYAADLLVRWLTPWDFMNHLPHCAMCPQMRKVFSLFVI